jgi:hypothetical protein
MPKSFSARIFVVLIVISGCLILGDAALNSQSKPTALFAAFLLVACLAARLKVKLPGLTGTMSVNLPFILLAAAEMSMAEALAAGFISTFVQCLPRGKQKLNLVQVAFSCSTITLAVAATRLVYTSSPVATIIPSPHLRLAVATAAYALANTIPIAIVIGFTEAVSAVRIWGEMLELSFPYLAASAAMAGLTLTITHEIGWQVPLALLPVMIGIFLSYRRYFAPTAGADASVAAPMSRQATAAVHI